MINRAPLRVGFLTTDNLRGHSGIDRYTSDLLRELVKRKDLAVVPVTSASDAAWLRESIPGIADLIITKASHGLQRSIEERYGLARRLARARIDVVHGTKHILPRDVPCPTVLTVYDLFVFTRGGDYRWSKRALLPAVYRQSMAQADRIIVMTRSVRRALATRGLVDEAKVEVIPAAPSTVLTGGTPDVVPTLADRRFALCVGDLSARKNVGLLLRIWPAVYRRTNLLLAIVGPDRSRSAAMTTRIDELERNGAVARVGSISDGALRWCYEHATVVLIPSLEEGYGLPAVEARQFGANLITSRDDALVEVSGGSALHLDVADENAWEHAIVALVEGPSESVPSRGLPVWSEIAALTAAVYRRAVQARSR